MEKRPEGLTQYGVWESSTCKNSVRRKDGLFSVSFYLWQHGADDRNVFVAGLMQFTGQQQPITDTGCGGYICCPNSFCHSDAAPGTGFGDSNMDSVPDEHAFSQSIPHEPAYDSRHRCL
jgi:hypothetical protein